jgi:hypothetical protein
LLGCGETEEIVRLVDSNNDDEVTIVAYESWIDQSTKLSMCKLKEGDNQRSIFVKDVVDVVFVVRRSEMLGSPDEFIGRDGYYVLEVGTPGIGFPCSCDEFAIKKSFTKSVFDEMERVRRLFRKMLCSSCQHQGQITQG